MGQPSSHALQHHIRVTDRALIVCSRRTDAAAPQNLHRSGSRSRSTVRTHYPAVTMRAVQIPQRTAQTAGGRWTQTIVWPTPDFRELPYARFYDVSRPRDFPRGPDFG